MALRLYNTMSSQIEEFQPLRDNEVRMYACGPTVYDYGHIGNFRTFVAVDLLYRFLRQSGYSVRYVMNITDVDDKIIRNAARDGVSVQQFTAKYEKAFVEDSAMINIEPPKLVRATEHIPQMAEFVAELVEKGLAYRTEDGSYYFRIAKFPAVRQAFQERFRGHAGRRARRRRRIRKRQRPRLRPVESAQARRGFVGDGDRTGSSGLAPRVLGHVDAGTGRELRSARGRRRSDLPASRKRNRAVGIADRQALRAFLVSRALPAGRRREDVEEPGQFLHPARSGAQGTQAVVDPLSADLGSLSQSAELHL